MAKKIKVYRLETDTQRGVYDSCLWDEATVESPIGSTRHPAPEQDKLLSGLFSSIHSSLWFFGFASLKQYKDWCYKKSWRKGFHQCELRLNVYLVDEEHFTRGEKQVMFRIKKAQLIKTMRPDYSDINN